VWGFDLQTYNVKAFRVFREKAFGGLLDNIWQVSVWFKLAIC
jgi:hypothetical protein